MKKLSKLDKIVNNITIYTICFAIGITYIAEKHPTEAKYVIDKLIFDDDNENIKNNHDQEINKIINSINTNDNLSNDEKSNILKLEDEITENAEYIDFDKVMENTSTINIMYNINDETSVRGEYSITNNIITLYELDDETIYHENAHLLTNYRNYTLSETLLMELTNQLFTCEYENIIKEDERDGYNEYMPIIYILLEIISEDALKEYRYNPSITIIIDDLLKLDQNINIPFDLINDINTHYNTTLKSENSQEENKEVTKRLYKNLNHYYKIKYNQNISDDLLLSSYLYDSLFQNNEIVNTVNNHGISNITDIYIKGYISEEYKENLKNTIIIFKNENNEMKALEITDDIRFKDNKVNIKAKKNTIN